MEQLRLIRYSVNKTQKELAEMLGVDRTVYSRYETGEYEPSISFLSSFASYFDIPASFLLETGVFKNWEDIMCNLDDFLAEIITSPFSRRYSKNNGLAISTIFYEVIQEKDIIMLVQLLDTYISEVSISYNDDESISKITIKPRSDVFSNLSSLDPDTIACEAFLSGSVTCSEEPNIVDTFNTNSDEKVFTHIYNNLSIDDKISTLSYMLSLTER